MTVKLKHLVTGHEIQADKDSIEFWNAAGYRETSPAKKAPAKKAAPSKKSGK